MSQICALKMVKVVNSVLCIFHSDSKLVSEHIITSCS